MLKIQQRTVQNIVSREFSFWWLRDCVHSAYDFTQSPVLCNQVSIRRGRIYRTVYGGAAPEAALSGGALEAQSKSSQLRSLCLAQNPPSALWSDLGFYQNNMPVSLRFN